MKKSKKFFKSERGAAQMVEAAIIYPIVFLILFVLVYLGVFILQSMSVSSYAQKIALLSAREVSYPGYSDTFVKNSSGNGIFSSAAVEADTEGKTVDEVVAFSFNPKQVQSRAYRYWKSDPLNYNNESGENLKDVYSGMLKTVMQMGSILASDDEPTVTIECENKILAQYINVTVEQKVLDFPFLSFFGFDAPTVSATAKAVVSDTDELVRNTDFAVDSIEALASKLGLDVKEIKSKLNDIKGKFGLD